MIFKYIMLIDKGTAIAAITSSGSKMNIMLIKNMDNFLNTILNSIVYIYFFNGPVQCVLKCLE